MELLKNVTKRMKEDKKFAFAVYVLIIIGIVMLFSSFTGSMGENTGNIGTQNYSNGAGVGNGLENELKNELKNKMEARLEAILQTIDGAGKVNVMVNTLNQNGTDSVSGVIVTAEGAENVGVRLKLHDAVCTVLGLENESVEIFEMREVENNEKE